MRKILIFVMIFPVVQGFSSLPSKFSLQGEDFLKGKFSGTSHYEEGIVLSIMDKKIDSPAEEFYFSAISDTKGNVYIGTGHDGKIWKITQNGKTTLLYDAPEMDVLALALDKAENLYAATSPNGKVYKITSDGKASVFFDPEEKLIWDISFDERGELYVACGEKAVVYRVSSDGSAKEVFTSAENHIFKVLPVKDGLLLGTGGEGLLVKVSDNRFTVLFDPPYKEVKEIIVDSENNIWIGCSARGSEPTKSSQPKEEPTISLTPSVSVEVVAFSVPSETKEVKISSGEKGGGIFKITSSGLSKEVWSSMEEIVYTLSFFEKEKKIYFGTGPNGRIYAIDKNERLYLVLQKDSESIYAITDNLFITNNPAKLFKIEASQILEGEFISHVLDAGFSSAWGRISWFADTPEGTSVQLMTRSGNKEIVDESWSAWSPPYKNSAGENVLSPKGRYIQFRVLFKSNSSLKTPVMKRVEIFYLQVNAPPFIKSVKLYPPHETFQKPINLEEEIIGYEKEKGLPEREKVDEEIFSIIPKTMGKRIYKKGFRTISWSAEDPNKDKLSYSIFIKEEKEKDWKNIKSDYTDTIISIDTFMFEDGIYRVKIIASDILSNPPENSFKNEKTSPPFFIDNTPPIVEGLTVKEEGEKRKIIFTAKDNLTPIKEVYYSHELGKWFVVFPADGICDSPVENFSIEVPRDKKDLIVKVIDTLDNVVVVRKSF
ncbi:MAG: WD40/YVTN/BNR-like repeat-containing protein [Candidatus Aminicenantia bacterium]